MTFRTHILTLSAVFLTFAGGFAQAEVFADHNMAAQPEQVLTAGSELTLAPDPVGQDKPAAIADSNLADLGTFFTNLCVQISQDCPQGDNNNSGSGALCDLGKNHGGGNDGGGKCPPPSSVPEPGSIVTMCLGGLILGFLGRKARA